ncbi:hypothetical protein ElyMa_005200200 [Elysia marginata]|uniref:Uncharacterized protein n=1 Tax=Elysia marginata TaxID=1093978 RepID=A0AAV4JVD3_9GAST|nr:hypothetical protein ElyMa_005200200 [Elysia marginata]
MDGFDSKFDLEELKEFLEPRTGFWGAAYLYRGRALNVVQNRLDWRADYRDTILAWLQQNTPAGTSSTSA